MEEEFWNLVPEECIPKMKSEKIDADLILLMSDEDLSRYIPLHGDRLRLKIFLTRSKQEKKEDRESERKRILNALRRHIEDRREKRKTRTASPSENDLEHKKARMSSSRDFQKNELKGLNPDVHLRRKRGGGIRKTRIRKDGTQSFLLEEGERLACPIDGKNVHNLNWETTNPDENPDETKNADIGDNDMNWETATDTVENPDEAKTADNVELLQNNKHFGKLSFDSESDQGDILQRAIALAGIVLDETNDEN